MPGRRDLLRTAALAGLATMPLAGTALAQAQGNAKGPQLLDFPGKDGHLVVLGDRPLVAETPESLLNDDTTPIDKFFIRNNGQIPDPVATPDAWSFKVEGEVNTPLTLSVGELKQRFAAKTYRMVLECGGNGRSFFSPPGRGNQWTNGGAGCARWTGVPLKDVLAAAGLKPDAKYTGSAGADPHLSGDTTKLAISRGNPIAKSMEEHTMLVWAMNDQPLPNIHGGPLRLLVPGWPGSLSTKWLNRIVVRSTPHDGQGMGGTSYRVPVTPIVPGSNDNGKTFRDLESMPVRGIITAPANGTRLAAGTRQVVVRGAAWAGDSGVAKVEISMDAGQTWTDTTMTPPTNPYDWVRWTRTITLPSDGYFELWVRATDKGGRAQSIVAANWNPQGYGGNPINRVAILVG